MHGLGRLLSKRQKIKVGEDVEKKEPLCTVGGNVNRSSNYGKRYGGSSKQLKIELPYKAATALLSLYIEEVTSASRRGTCSPVFFAAFFAVAKMST